MVGIIWLDDMARPSTTLRIAPALLSTVDTGYSPSRLLDNDRVAWRHLRCRRGCLTAAQASGERTRRESCCAINITPVADVEGGSAVFFANGGLFAYSTRDAMWSIGSSPILQTGAEEALHFVAEKRCWTRSCASWIHIYQR